ncbi:unnamed protein product, partial [Ectocarpus sp. 12 AP-2014]
MPDLGGNVLYCRDLVARLSDGISPCALPLTDQVLGRLETITIEELAEIFAAMLCERFPEGEIHLAGFSFAGILAFETARALEKSNRPVSHVWLFDTRAHRLHMPSVVRQAPLRELKSFVSYFTKRLVERNLNDDGTVLHSYRLLTLDLNERPKAYWPIIRSMHRALSSYRPKPVLDMPLTLFRAKEAAGQPIRPDFLGWDRLTRGSATVISVEADHMSIM